MRLFALLAVFFLSLGLFSHQDAAGIAAHSTAVTQDTSATKDTTTFEKIPVYVTKGGNNTSMRYHKDGCRYLKKGQIQVSEKNAVKRGLMPCSVCLKDRYEAAQKLKKKQKPTPNKKAVRKCTYKTSKGTKCQREATTSDGKCEIHKNSKKPKKKRR